MKFLYLITLLFIQSVMARPMSAWRDPGIDYTFYEGHDFLKSSADYQATPFTGENLAEATPWTISNLASGYKKIRNVNYLPSPNKPAFPRRIPWLYPNDGCFVRVQLANSLLKKAGYPTPTTVIAIGNLFMRTKNSPRGYVSWWYHVAPVIQLKGVYFVLDPAVDPDGPLPIFKWLSTIGTPAKIRVAICGSGASNPRSDCGDSQPRRVDSSKYLNAEWNQLYKLGKNPETILSQPW